MSRVRTLDRAETTPKPRSANPAEGINLIRPQAPLSPPYTWRQRVQRRRRQALYWFFLIVAMLWVIIGLQ